MKNENKIKSTVNDLDNIILLISAIYVHTMCTP